MYLLYYDNDENIIEFKCVGKQNSDFNDIKNEIVDIKSRNRNVLIIDLLK